MTDKEFLAWVYTRMINVHKENPLFDYMYRFKHLIDQVPDNVTF